MFTSNDGVSMAAMNARKRKMKEVAVDESPVPQQPPPPQNNISLSNLQTRNLFAGPSIERVQQMLNTAGPMPFRPFGSTLKPFSFMSLLTAPEHEPVEISHSMQLDQIITHQSDNLKQVFVGMMKKQQCESEARAAKRLKEKEEEIQAKYVNKYSYLEQMLEYFKGENDRLASRERCLESTATMLKDKLDEANAALDEVEEYEDDDEEDEDETDHEAREDVVDSESFKDPNRGNPVMLDCKNCHRQRATMVIWPCRCVSLCKGCERSARTCPICRTVKTVALEVFIPHE